MFDLISFHVVFDVLKAVSTNLVLGLILIQSRLPPILTTNLLKLFSCLFLGLPCERFPGGWLSPSVELVCVLRRSDYFYARNFVLEKLIMAQLVKIFSVLWNPIVYYVFTRTRFGGQESSSTPCLFKTQLTHWSRVVTKCTTCFNNQ